MESRFILANTEQLHEKIFQLSDRVRQLEEGLGTMQSSVSPETHPLLSPDLLRIKISQDLYASTIQALPAESSSFPKEDALRASVSALSLNPLASQRGPYIPVSPQYAPLNLIFKMKHRVP